MIINKKVTVELTEQERKILNDCEEVIDRFIDKMEELNLIEYRTKSDCFDKYELDTIANIIHSLTTVNEAD